MSDPTNDANKRRAEAQRARRLAASLSQPADQDRLKQYAEELERKAAKDKAGRAHTRQTGTTTVWIRSSRACPSVGRVLAKAAGLGVKAPNAANRERGAAARRSTRR